MAELRVIKTEMELEVGLDWLIEWLHFDWLIDWIHGKEDLKETVDEILTDPPFKRVAANSLHNGTLYKLCFLMDEREILIFLADNWSLSIVFFCCTDKGLVSTVVKRLAV